MFLTGFYENNGRNHYETLIIDEQRKKISASRNFLLFFFLTRALIFDMWTKKLSLTHSEHMRWELIKITAYYYSFLHLSSVVFINWNHVRNDFISHLWKKIKTHLLTYLAISKTKKISKLAIRFWWRNLYDNIWLHIEG